VAHITKIRLARYVVWLAFTTAKPPCHRPWNVQNSV